MYLEIRRSFEDSQDCVALTPLAVVLDSDMCTEAAGRIRRRGSCCPDIFPGRTRVRKLHQQTPTSYGRSFKGNDKAVVGVAGYVFKLIKVKLVTGRTHQIRVHMASLGQPLVGARAKPIEPSQPRWLFISIKSSCVESILPGGDAEG
eukprot:4413860-Amphidinium_carterae.1